MEIHRVPEASQAPQRSEIHPLDAASTVPDASLFFERYARESAATRAKHPHLRNVRYGRTDAETLDFFSAGTGTPLAIFYHGGYWRRLDKDDFSFIARALLPLGISFVSVNYGLAPAVPLREIVAQARRAARWCREGAVRLAVDPERICVFGHSAGGHLATMVAADMPVCGAATLSGLHDLEPVRTSFVNEWIGLDEAEAHALSPVHVPPAQRCRVLAAVGEKESADGFKVQGRAIVEAWEKHGCAGEYLETPDDDHYTICLRLLDRDDMLVRKIAALVR